MVRKQKMLTIKVTEEEGELLTAIRNYVRIFPMETPN